MTDESFDAGTYGRSFSDVYDQWYPPDGSTDAAVNRLCELTDPSARILELGVGTGRLAIPLAATGRRMLGIDSSPEMLEHLELNCARANVHVEGIAADAAEADTWPSGPFDCVVTAFNLLFNLADRDAQQRCFDAAAASLSPRGIVVLEAFIPAPIDHRELRLEVKEVDIAKVVLIATDAEAGTGVVTGQHIELSHGQSVRLRPWRICATDISTIDQIAANAGLEITKRASDWSGTPLSADSQRHVSVYRRAQL